MDLELDLATYWSGVRDRAAANRWWLAAIASAFVLGVML